MSIQENLNTIKNAVYGNEVRNAIVDSIEECYNDASKNGNANMEVSIARGTYNTLNERLNENDSVVSQKADKSYVDTKVNAVSRGTPTPVSSVDEMTDTTKTYLLTTDGYWYYHNGTSWVQGGVYQATNVEDNSITTNKLANNSVLACKTNFIKQGKNIFNKDEVVEGHYVDPSNNAYGSNTYFCVSDYVPIIGGAKYSYYIDVRLTFYDKDKKYIGGVFGGHAYGSATAVEFDSNGRVVTAPSNAKYVRMSPLISEKDVFCISQENTFSGAEKYKHTMDYLELKESNIPDKLITNNKLDMIKESVNLFNKATATSGSFVYPDTGLVGTNSYYFMSDYIAVRGNTKYTLNKHCRIAFYDASKAYIGGYYNNTNYGNVTTEHEDYVNLSPATYTTPINCAYVRFGDLLTLLDSFQFQIGEEATDLEEYGAEKIDSNLIDLSSYGFLKSTKIVNKLALATTTKKIVLLGDSITHGVGGTGFAQDGDLIVTDSNNVSYYRNPNGICWANMLKTYLEAKFNCTVTNNGCTGTTSIFTAGLMDTLCPTDTDIAICMIGHNNRLSYGRTLEQYYSDLGLIYNHCKRNNIDIVFMSDIPATVENEEGSAKGYHIEDLRNVMAKFCIDNNMEFIDNYYGLLDYCANRDIDIDTIYADNQHPNDTGHTILFELVCKGLGIAIRRPNATWNN